MLGRIRIVIMFLSNPGAGSVAGGSSSGAGLVAVVVFLSFCCCCRFCRGSLCYWRCWSLLSLLVSSLSLLFLSRSNNYSIDPNLSSLLSQTTPFVNPIIYHSSRITKPHPPTRFHCPPHFSISKNGVFIPKRALFTDFRPFFALSSV